MNDSIDIDLTEINWNKLSVDEFSKVEKKLQQNNKIIKDSKSKEKRNSGIAVVTLHGQEYEIKEIVLMRLKNLKSNKAKEKLIESIIASSNPIEKL